MEDESISEEKYRPESTIIKHSNTGKEYYFSLSKSNYAEIIDFKNEEIFFRTSFSFASDLSILSFSNSFFFMIPTT